jgi:hypothetical protein
MKYDLTKDVGVYNAHPTFEPFGLPAVVVDYAEDGSWMVLICHMYPLRSNTNARVLDL